MGASVSMAQTYYYVNGYLGNNTWNGLSPIHTYGSTGPKRTIQSAVKAARAGDVISISCDYYDENLTLGKDLTLLAPRGITVERLTITNNSTITLSADSTHYFTISNQLTISEGTLNTGDGRIVISSTSPGAVSIVAGSIRGEVSRTISPGSTGRYVFTDAQTAITPNGLQGNTLVRIRSFQSAVPPYTSNNSIRRYYTVASGGSLSGSLCLAYTQNELNGINEADLSSFRLVGSTWVDQGGAPDPGLRCITIPSVTLSGVSTWTLGDVSHPLPIQLASFIATVANQNCVTLTWVTASETNNYGFVVQRRTTSTNDFTDLPESFVPGHGTTLEPQTYTWTDFSVPAGVYYYRLKQMDLDGTTSYSDPQEVSISSPTGVATITAPTEFILQQNYPNPFNPSTNIQFTVSKQGYTTLTVFDALGKEVGRLYDGNAEPGVVYNARFDGTALTNGAYFCRLTNGGQTSIKKMLLLK